MGMGLVGLAEGGEFQLEKVTKVKSLLPLLQERLPKSCNVFNMAQNHHKFQNEMCFYIMTSGISGPRESLHKDSWILATYEREDYGMDINISAPRNPLFQAAEFKSALLKSGIVPWEEPFIFAATEKNIVSLIQEVMLEATGKKGKKGKNIMFYTASPQCHPLLTTFTVQGSTIELKPLDVKEGAKFLVDNWPFATSGSLAYIRKLIERNRSSGVFIDGRLVAGAAVNGSGLITMLHTLQSERNKGYAQLCMNYLCNLLLKDNLIPCCTVEISNIASLSLQRKIGLQKSHEAYYITRS